jgi:hypothetical protein
VVKYRELEERVRPCTWGDNSYSNPELHAAGGSARCEASTYTEYVQIGSVARVTGTVSISACPARTTGEFTLVAQVRDDAGTSTPIEFSEMWANDDAQDYIFFAEKARSVLFSLCNP